MSVAKQKYTVNSFHGLLILALTSEQIWRCNWPYHDTSSNTGELNTRCPSHLKREWVVQHGSQWPGTAAL